MPRGAGGKPTNVFADVGGGGEWDEEGRNCRARKLQEARRIQSRLAKRQIVTK